MPDARRRYCQCCRRHDSVCGPISWRGNCLECSKALVAENVIGISEKRGWAFRRQALGMLRYAEQALLTTGHEERSV